jgi:DNA-binding NtrC family response regulator
VTRKRRILVVEDDNEIGRTIGRFLEREGHEAVHARDGQLAIEQLESGASFDLILTDLEMPRAGGEEVLRAGLRRSIPVVVLTGKSTVDIAVRLMKQGAANFLSKPFTPTVLREILSETFGRTDFLDSSVVGDAPAFRQVVDLIASIAETDATVLILGESGTGKEVIANTIHKASPRADGPFVAVNCGAIPEALLESEMFGHTKGAFTGATHARVGRLKMASGGTLFLDEIGDMPLAFQVKMLRVLQEHKYEVLGENESRSCDLRVIAATHRDLGKRVADGHFREDLFYRLNVIDIHLPPLRERLADLPLLVEHFIATANARHQRHVESVSPEALQQMLAYGWPGNIRELAHCVERMVVLRRAGRLEVGDLPPNVRQVTGTPTSAAKQLPAEGIDLNTQVAAFEQSMIAQALSRTGGNRTAAAALLGLNRTTLVEKLKRFER